MKPMRVTSAIYSGLLLAVCLATRPSLAQSEAELQQAREEFREALALQSAGDCAGALPLLRRVARIKLTPHVRFNIALCEERVGKLVAAFGNYRLALEDAEAASLPEVADPARAALKALEERVPRVTIVRGSGAEQASIILDGTPLGDAAIGRELQRDPGPHKVIAKINRRVVFEEEFRLEEHGRKTVEVTAPPSNEGVEVDTPTAPRAAAGESSSAQRTVGFIVGGVGIASLAAGGVFIVLRQQSVDELESQCDDLRCPPSAEEHVDRGRLYTGLAEAAVLVGVAGVTTGLVLVLSSGSSGQREVSLAVGGTSQKTGVALRGSF